LFYYFSLFLYFLLLFLTNQFWDHLSNIIFFGVCGLRDLFYSEYPAMHQCITFSLCKYVSRSGRLLVIFRLPTVAMTLRPSFFPPTHPITNTFTEIHARDLCAWVRILIGANFSIDQDSDFPKFTRILCILAWNRSHFFSLSISKYIIL